MRPSSRKAFVWAFSALFGCISLFGQGLHYFVGHAHEPGHAHFASHAHPSEHCHHGHEHACELAGDHCEADDDGPACIAGSAHDHDCAICEFFAQSQLNFDFVLEIADELASFSAALPTQRRLVAFVGFYNTRAPPAAVAC